MSKRTRLKHLEKSMSKSNKYWVVLPLIALYGHKVEKPYWTDEKVKDHYEFLNSEPYRKVKHPIHGYEVPKGMA